MFGGGSYEEVARWLRNFVASHAKLESPRVEGIVEASEERGGKFYHVRLRLGDRYFPSLNYPPVELAYPEVAEGKGNLAWCEATAERVRGWARQLLEAESTPPHAA
jgi:hypothetical protein